MVVVLADDAYLRRLTKFSEEVLMRHGSIALSPRRSLKLFSVGAALLMVVLAAAPVSAAAHPATSHVSKTLTAQSRVPSTDPCTSSVFIDEHCGAAPYEAKPKPPVNVAGETLAAMGDVKPATMGEIVDDEVPW